MHTMTEESASVCCEGDNTVSATTYLVHLHAYLIPIVTKTNDHNTRFFLRSGMTQALTTVQIQLFDT